MKWIALVVVVLIVAFYLWCEYTYWKEQGESDSDSDMGWW